MQMSAHTQPDLCARFQRNRWQILEAGRCLQGRLGNRVAPKGAQRGLVRRRVWTDDDLRRSEALSLPYRYSMVRCEDVAQSIDVSATAEGCAFECC
ncbi:hypothetical protein CBR_g54333 [Chara braunii]|uniref:Uncharacterized protein n=1 Tax=Chara braunii TaxID=69332 RepID=A0A388MBY3_CHABU|nr:hypothetical protein CBR_g54333 [Chara braunii]|eukprot:GBG92078.1 hypothetical protein CBR_g54333 [Chara braunii]